jgi:hypothetical protein
VIPTSPRCSSLSGGPIPRRSAAEDQDVGCRVPDVGRAPVASSSDLAAAYARRQRRRVRRGHAADAAEAAFVPRWRAGEGTFAPGAGDG